MAGVISFKRVSSAGWSWKHDTRRSIPASVLQAKTDGNAKGLELAASHSGIHSHTNLAMHLALLHPALD
jgi:hypothetical protein